MLENSILCIGQSGRMAVIEEFIHCLHQASIRQALHRLRLKACSGVGTSKMVSCVTFAWQGAFSKTKQYQERLGQTV